MHSLTRNPVRLAWTVATFLALAAVAFAPVSARADWQDPSTLQIGPATNFLFYNNTEVHPLTSGTVTVTNTSAGAGDLNVPWYVILGIANATSTNAQILSGPGTPYPVSGTYVASLTSGQDAYSQLGLDAGTNNSNSFTNWSAADLAINGITATSFGLFEYKIPGTLGGKATDTFQFSNLLQGTFVIAYGTVGTAATNGSIYDTPFTESGVTTGTNAGPGAGMVPAPSSVILLGIGTLGLLGFAGVRRFRRLPVAA